MKGPQGLIPTDTVTRKAHKRVAYADRTDNRHRCSGRVDQGERVILRQGTRQFNGRNFGIRPARRETLAATKESMRLFTKNTGLC